MSRRSLSNNHSVAALAFGELKPHSASFKEGRLDLVLVLVYYQFRYRPPALPFPTLLELTNVHPQFFDGLAICLPELDQRQRRGFIFGRSRLGSMSFCY